MSEWKKVKLGEITDSCLGKMLDAAKNRGEYQPYLANLNVRWGYFDTDNLSQMKFEKDEQERYGIKYGDLIICEGGEPGRCAIWKEQLPNMKIQKALHRVRPKEGVVDNFYLFYWFLLAGKKKIIDQYCTGATIKHLPGQKLKEVVVDLPPLDVQRRIAEVLSRYDSLIENYKHQIKLLEEAAQRLYKEWFVDLHFPGYETTPIIDGIPEGWEKTLVMDVFDFKYGKILPIKELITDGPIPVYGASKRIGYYNKANCFEPKVLVGSRGNAGYVHRTYENGAYVTNNSFIISTQPGFEYIRLPYIYEAFRAMDFVAICTGAAQPQLTLSSIASLSFLLPLHSLIDKFSKCSLPIFERIDKAYKQIRNLTEARDRLLPKLMSGNLIL